MAGAVGEVEDPARHEQRLARRRDVTEPRGNERLAADRTRRATAAPGSPGSPPRPQRRAVEAERERVVAALVERLARAAVGTPVAGREAIGLRRADAQLAPAPGLGLECALAQRQPVRRRGQPPARRPSDRCASRDSARAGRSPGCRPAGSASRRSRCRRRAGSGRRSARSRSRKAICGPGAVAWG